MSDIKSTQLRKWVPARLADYFLLKQFSARRVYINVMRKIFTAVLITLLFTASTNPANAFMGMFGNKPNVSQNANKPKLKPNKQNMGVLEQLNLNVSRIIGGVVAGVNGSVISVNKDGKTYAVATDDKTLFRRHFWGKSSLTEYSPGDRINVWGRWTNQEHTSMNARMVRNMSIMKKDGIIMGKVISKNTGSFIVEKATGSGNINITVNFDGNTRFIKLNGTDTTYANISIDDKVRIRGLFDVTLKSVTNVTEVKDFTLPL